MAEFNVLNEPWIPVMTISGTAEKYGIMEALTKAHEMAEVACESPLETYAVQRFLIAFLMDAYRHELLHGRDRKKLFERGKFDPAVIASYIELCRNEGVTFDLFDPEKPFYQATFDERYDSDAKIKPIANLFHAIPSGNNPVHFEHKVADESECTPAQALRALLAAQLFATSMTQGYPSSVNDTPCYYALLKGRNLFETLCLSMLSVGECQGIDFDSALPAWRDRSPEIPKAEHADVSMLEGLTFRPRRVTIICEEDGMVRKLYFQQGQSFHPNGRWIDPHVTYSVNKDGDYVTVKPHLGRMPWRDVAAFAFSKDNKYSRPATILAKSGNVLDRSDPRIITMYGLTSSQAKYEDWITDSLSVPGDILFDEYKSESLRASMKKVEDTASLVFRTVNSISNAVERTKDGKKKQSEAAAEAQMVFFTEMHDYVFSEYMPALVEADYSNEDWETVPNKVINKALHDCAKRIVKDYAQKLGSTARCLEAQAEQLRFFNGLLNKILNERKEDD